jgi:hypothetical protein
MADLYYEQVVLLLHGDGIDNGTSIIDQKGHLFTNYGALTKTGIKKFGTSSIYFNGINDHIVSPASNDFFFSTAPFTIEAWIYLTGNAAINPNSERSCVIFSQFYSSGGGFTFSIIGNSTTTGTGLMWDDKSGGQTGGRCSAAISKNAWHHIAICRKDTTIYMFLDGLLIGTSTLTANKSLGVGTSYAQYIGGIPGVIYWEGYFPGYIDELRITKGTARYTESFTIPTEAFPNIANILPDPYYDLVSLLIHADGINNGTYFIDSSVKNNTLVRASTITKTDIYKFGGSSAYFDGVNAILYTGVGALNLGTSDFTIEFWMYAINGGHGGSYSRIIATAADGTNGALYITTTGLDNPTRILVQYYDTAYRTVAVSNNTISNNIWHHIALCRSGTTWKLFIDGVQESLYTDLNPNLTTTICYIGNNTTQTADFYGYLDEIRITDGVARYTEPFTPAIAPFSNISNNSIDLYYDQVVLLLHCDGKNNGTTIIDKKGHAIIRDTAVTKTDDKKFGVSSIYSTSTGFHISPSPDFSLGSLNFTIEFWFNFTALPANGVSHWIFNSWSFTSTSCAYAINVYNTSGLYYLRFYYGSGSTLSYNDFPINIEISQWNHFAVVRAVNGLYVYQNGLQIGTVKLITATINNIAASLYWFGGVNTAPSGYLDDFRITKGHARYVPTGIVPNEPYPTTDDPYWSYVTCLLHMDGIDNGTLFVDEVVGNSVSVSGDVKTKLGNTKFGTASAYFDGSGDYLTVTSTTNDGFKFGTADFTIECWVYLAATGSHRWAYRINSSNGCYLAYNNTSGKFNISPGNGQSVDSKTTWAVARWYHTCVVRVSGVMYLYVDGFLECSMANVSNYTDGSCEVGTGTTAFYGYIDDFRVTKNFARHQTPHSFNIQGAPHPDNKDESFDPYWSDTILLMHMDGQNNGNIFTDVKGHTIAPQGNSITSESIYKYGTSSAQFDANGDYLSLPVSSEFAVGTDNFTIEFWGRLSAITTHRRAFAFCGTNGPRLMTTGVNQPFVSILGGNAINSSSITATTGVWRHFAFVRSNGYCRLYIDGSGTTWIANSTNVTGADFTYIGADGTSMSSMCWEGNIDDFRFTKGVCRYNNNFIPPTRSLAHGYSTNIYRDTGYKQKWYLNALHEVMDINLNQKYNINIFERFNNWILNQRYNINIFERFKDRILNQKYSINIFERFKDFIITHNYNLLIYPFKDLILNQKYSINIFERFNNFKINFAYLLNTFDKTKDFITGQYYKIDVFGNKSNDLNSQYKWTLNTFSIDSNYLSLQNSWILDTFGKVDYLEFKRKWKIIVDFNPIIKFGNSFENWEINAIIEKNKFLDPYNKTNLATLIKPPLNDISILQTKLELKPNTKYYFKIWTFIPKNKQTLIYFQLNEDIKSEDIILTDNGWNLCNWEFTSPDSNLESNLSIYISDEIILYGAWIDIEYESYFIDVDVYDHYVDPIELTFTFSNCLIEQLDMNGNQLVTKIDSSKPKININSQWIPISNIKVRRSNNWNLSPFYIFKYKNDNKWL